MLNALTKRVFDVAGIRAAPARQRHRRIFSRIDWLQGLHNVIDMEHPLMKQNKSM
jgi:hypothetical protein